MTGVASEFCLPKQYLWSLQSPYTLSLFSRQTKAGVHVRDVAPRQTPRSGEGSPVKQQALKTRSEWDRLAVLVEWMYELEAPSQVELHPFAPQFMRTLLWAVDRLLLLYPDVWFQMGRRWGNLSILDLFRNQCRPVCGKSELSLASPILFRTSRRCRVQHPAKWSGKENMTSKGKSNTTLASSFATCPLRNKPPSRDCQKPVHRPNQSKVFQVAFWLK